LFLKTKSTITDFSGLFAAFFTAFYKNFKNFKNNGKPYTTSITDKKQLKKQKTLKH